MNVRRTWDITTTTSRTSRSQTTGTNSAEATSKRSAISCRTDPSLRQSAETCVRPVPTTRAIADGAPPSVMPYSACSVAALAHGPVLGDLEPVHEVGAHGRRARRA